MELHQLYLERLASVKDEGLELPAVTGVFDLERLGFREAVEPVAALLRGLERHVGSAHEFGKRHADATAGTAGAAGVAGAAGTAGTAGTAATLDAEAVAALHLYTCESAFYRELNAALRHPDRARLAPYLPYLRLLFDAVGRLPVRPEPLWRGVALDLRAQYPLGRTVTWWGVSSCTSRPAVARSFLGSRGKRTLFEVRPARAVGIREFSAFTEEEEYILLPGTQLTVTDVVAERGGLCTVTLTESAEPPLVS
jgi:hypothetical protein